ncbi:MAG: hypothetical protein ING19_07175 [Azospirillum sp.]|nr:hypothetical protein [Azospirillum sp.]
MKRGSWAERFGRLGEIDAARPRTWEGRLFLTLDLDWAIDAAIGQCLDHIEQAGVAATIFVTHDTPLLARMRRNPRLELGLHPNFNPLLEGAAGAGDARRVMSDLQRIVPDAKVVRSHSMTQSSRLLELFIEFGMTHDSNHFVPAHAGIELKPYRHWNSALTRVPYFWEDDVDLEYASGQSVLDLAAAGGGLKVFDFHPIHVALNTPSIEHYARTRPSHGTPAALLDAAWRGPDGVRGRFEALLRGETRE